MTLYDDIHQRPRLNQGQERVGYITYVGPPQSSGRHDSEKVFADRSNEQGKMTWGTGYAIWREVIVTWLLAALLALALLAVSTPDVPHPIHAVSTSTASVPHPDDAARARVDDGDDSVPCSDLDYAYQKC